MIPWLFSRSVSASMIVQRFLARRLAFNAAICSLLIESRKEVVLESTLEFRVNKSAANGFLIFGASNLAANCFRTFSISSNLANLFEGPS